MFLTHFKNAAFSQFHNFVSDSWVLQVRLSTLWVCLHLFQNLSHNRVPQNSLDFRILHCSFSPLFLAHISTVAILSSFSIADTFFSLSVVRINFKTFLKCCDGFAVFLHCNETVSLSQISFYKLRIQFNTFFGILQRVWDLHHLSVACRSVAINPTTEVSIIRISFQSLSVFLNSLWELRSFKKLISLGFVLGSEVRVNLLSSLQFLYFSLHFLLGIQIIFKTVVCQGFIIKSHSFFQLLFGCVSFCHTSIAFCNDFEISSIFHANLLSFFASFNAFVKFLHFHIHGSNVEMKHHVCWVNLSSF
eukprot:m.218692 g.218692  ORF g.218692 m.218692 type:complete len:304 (+) comp15905_c1_seq5:109-1020(+)